MFELFISYYSAILPGAIIGRYAGHDLCIYRCCESPTAASLMRHSALLPTKNFKFFVPRYAHVQLCNTFTSYTLCFGDGIAPCQQARRQGVTNAKPAMRAMQAKTVAPRQQQGRQNNNVQGKGQGRGFKAGGDRVRSFIVVRFFFYVVYPIKRPPFFPRVCLFSDLELFYHHLYHHAQCYLLSFALFVLQTGRGMPPRGSVNQIVGGRGRAGGRGPGRGAGRTNGRGNDGGRGGRGGRGAGGGRREGKGGRGNNGFKASKDTNLDEGLDECEQPLRKAGRGRKRYWWCKLCCRRGVRDEKTRRGQWRVR